MYVKHIISGLCAVVALTASCALGSGKIMTVERENAKLKLKTWMVIGHKYQLQCSTDITSGNWQNVGDEITADLTSTNLVVGTEAKSCWFRVVEKKTVQSGPTSPPEPPPLEFKKPPTTPPPPFE